ncbi:Histone H1-like protein, partial [Drosera capensis]
MSNSGESEAPVMEKQATEAKPEEENKEKAPTKKKRTQHKPASHPPYFQMIKEALTTLNEKTGSSAYAIAKYVEENHKSELSSNFKKILGLQLKNSALRGKLIKIKASYKLSEAGEKQRRTARKAARANAAKPKEITEEKTKTKEGKAKPKGGGRRTRKTAPAKAKQPKSVGSPAARKAKKAITDKLPLYFEREEETEETLARCDILKERRRLRRLLPDVTDVYNNNNLTLSNELLFLERLFQLEKTRKLHGRYYSCRLLSKGLAGIEPVDVPGIENVDVTDIIDGHSSCLW